MTAEEFIARWGFPDTFVTYDSDIVRSLAVPETTKDFLIYPGIPSTEEMFIVFDNRLPVLQEAYGPIFEQEGTFFYPECQHMRVLGGYIHTLSENKESIVSFVLIDERQNGAIMSLGYDSGGNLHPLFCNSSLQQFVEYQLLLKEYDAWIREQEQIFDRYHQFDALKMQIEPPGRAIAKILREIDPAVSTAVDLYWARPEHQEYGMSNWDFTLHALEEGWLSTYH